jgi:integrase
MRLKESFTLYKRKLQSGKTVWYYQCYDKNGRRVCGHSTGRATKTAAKEYCLALLKEDKLIPLGEPGGRCPTFEEFARDFWDYAKSPYIRSRRGRGDITRSYADQSASVTRKHLTPHFGSRRLDTITQNEVDDWLTSHEQREVSAVMANSAFSRLTTMMNWAVFKRLIPANPCQGLKKLAVEEKIVEVPTVAEIKSLFPEDYTAVWDHRLFSVLYKLACCTGMRISELLGLKGECLFDTHILVHRQYNRYGYCDTKTHTSRNIPLHPKLIEDLKWLRAANNNGYLFSENGGELPVRYSEASKQLKTAFIRIGISEEEQKRRRLTNHSFRYFLNTLLVNRNINIKKIHAVTGHTNEKMTNHYTSFDALEFSEILDAQESLF